MKITLKPILKTECGPRSLILREERRLNVFENRIMRLIIWAKEDADGEWRRLHNEVNS